MSGFVLHRNEHEAEVLQRLKISSCAERDRPGKRLCLLIKDLRALIGSSWTVEKKRDVFHAFSSTLGPCSASCSDRHLLKPNQRHPCPLNWGICPGVLSTIHASFLRLPELRTYLDQQEPAVAFGPPPAPSTTVYERAPCRQMIVIIAPNNENGWWLTLFTF